VSAGRRWVSVVSLRKGKSEAVAGVSAQDPEDFITLGSD
jgi:hypothetical protein